MNAPTSKNIIRKVVIGILVLLGALVLAGTTYWLSYFIWGTLNPQEVRPREDWSLFLGVGAFPLLIISIVETLSFSILTKYQWLPYSKGKVGVWLFSAIAGLFYLFFIWYLLPINLLWCFGYSMVILPPLIFSFLWLKHS